MTNRVEHLVTRLAERGAETVAFYRALTPDQLDTSVYDADGDHPNWTARDLLEHSVQAERNILQLLKSVKQGGSGAPDGFDVDRFNREHTHSLAEASVEDLLAAFEAARADTVAFVKSLEESDLDRPARHPSDLVGEVDMETVIKVIYAHLRGHQRDIQKALGL